MNPLSALQTTPAASDAGAKRSREPKIHDNAAADTGFAKLMQQQTQQRQASQRQLAQRQAESRQQTAATQAAGTGKGTGRTPEQDLGPAESLDTVQPALRSEADPVAAPQTPPQPVQSARRAPGQSEATELGDEDKLRLSRHAELPAGPDAALLAADALTPNAALLVNGPGTHPGVAAADAAVASGAADRALTTGLAATALAQQAATANLAQVMPRHALPAGRDPGTEGVGKVDLGDGGGDLGDDHATDSTAPSGHRVAAGRRPDAALAPLRTKAEQLPPSTRPTALDAARDEHPELLASLPGQQPVAIDSAPRVAEASALSFNGALAGMTAVAGPATTAPLATANGIAASAHAQIPVPLDSPLFAPALGSQISLLARDGVQTALLQLNPAEMGPISVQIMLDGQAARVDFQADLAHTRSVIEASLPALASALQDAGLTLAGGGVFQQSPGHQDGGSGQPQATARGAEQRQGGDAAAVASPTSRAAARRGLVDLVA